MKLIAHPPLQKRPIFYKSPILKVLGNRMLVAAFLGSLALQVLVISLPFTQAFFKLEALSLASWGIVAALGFAPVLASEVIKIFLRRRSQQTG